MKKSRLSWYKQERLIEYFVGGVMARCAARLVGVNKDTATYYYHRLRMLIATHLEQEAKESGAILFGEVEVDESYFGGVRKGKRGRGAGGKVPVFGILQRGGLYLKEFEWRYNHSDFKSQLKQLKQWVRKGYN